MHAPLIGDHDITFYNTVKNSKKGQSKTQIANRMVMDVSQDGSLTGQNEMNRMHKVINRLENELKDQTEKTHYLLSLRKENAMSPSSQKHMTRNSVNSTSKISTIAKRKFIPEITFCRVKS